MNGPQSSQYITAHSGSYTAHGTGNSDDYLITPPINTFRQLYYSHGGMLLKVSHITTHMMYFYQLQILTLLVLQ